MARYAMPSTPTRLHQRVPVANSCGTPPQLQRLPRCATRVFRKHSSWTAIFGDECPRMTPDILFLQYGPILEVFPRRPVTFATAFGPMPAVERDPSCCSVQNKRQTLLLPRAPPRFGPRFAFKCFFDEPFRVVAISP